jgi:hypothetical protein
MRKSGTKDRLLASCVTSVRQKGRMETAFSQFEIPVDVRTSSNHVDGIPKYSIVIAMSLVYRKDKFDFDDEWHFRSDCPMARGEGNLY